MNQDLLRVNILSIVVAGLLILLTGVILYIFRDQVVDKVRYFLPLPPLGVASYIFVFNMFRHYDGKLPEGSWIALKEVVVGTAVAAAAFGVFTFLLVFTINFLKR
ncbi:MAG: hypothetical protein ACK2T3_12190 [Candidatus Promineifilaceae bacterium]